MKRDGLRQQGSFVALLAGFILLCLSPTGCGKHPSGQGRKDPEMRALEMIAQYPWMPPDGKELAQLAISKYQHGIIDPEPILICATLGKPIGIDRVDLDFAVLDEDEDLSGFVVREESQCPGGDVTASEEDYPVYVHFRSPGIADVHMVPVQIRESRQRKDENRWLAYLNTDFDALARERIRSGIMSRKSLSSGQFWQETLPPVWISIPEPNSVTVWVYVYDKAGHKSQPVRLLNLIGVN